MNTPPAAGAELAFVHALDVDAQWINTLRDLNALCIELWLQRRFGAGAGARTAAVVPSGPLRETSIGTAALMQRARSVPFLLFDLHFTHVEWWQLARSHTDHSWHLDRIRGLLPQRHLVRAARAVLIFAWHTSLTCPDAATLYLGIRRDICRELQAMSIADIQRVADRHGTQLRPRWERHSAFWYESLMSQQQDISTLQLRGLQVLSGELLSPRGDPSMRA